MEKQEKILLGVGILGLLGYLIYKKEKNRLRDEAKASTKKIISPIMDVLTSESDKTKLKPRLRVLEDLFFYKDIIDGGNVVGKDLDFVIPKGVVVETNEVNTPFGFANIDISKTEEVLGDTELSKIIAISADDYYNKPKKLWNPPIKTYEVSNLENSSYNEQINEDWTLNYYDAKGDEKEIIVPAESSVTIVAVDINHIPDSVVTNFESTITEVKGYVKYGTYRVLDDIFYDANDFGVISINLNNKEYGFYAIKPIVNPSKYQKDFENLLNGLSLERTLSGEKVIVNSNCGGYDDVSIVGVIPKGRILNIQVIVNKDDEELYTYDSQNGILIIEKNKLEQVPLDTPISENTIENDIELLKYNSDFQDFFGRYRKPLLECDEFERLFYARNKKTYPGGHVLSDSEIQAFIDQKNMDWGEDFFKNDGFVQQVELNALAKEKYLNPEIFARNYVLQGESVVYY
jgi:hypothetical protein